MRAANDRNMPTESPPPMDSHLGVDVLGPQTVNLTHLPMVGWNDDNTHTDDPSQTEFESRIGLQGQAEEPVSEYDGPHLGGIVQESQSMTHIPPGGWNDDDTHTDDPDQTESDFTVERQDRTEASVSGYMGTRQLKMYEVSVGDEWSTPSGAATAQTDGGQSSTLSESQEDRIETNKRLASKLLSATTNLRELQTTRRELQDRSQGGAGSGRPSGGDRVNGGGAIMFSGTASTGGAAAVAVETGARGLALGPTGATEHRSTTETTGTPMDTSSLVQPGTDSDAEADAMVGLFKAEREADETTQTAADIPFSDSYMKRGNGTADAMDGDQAM